MEKHVFLNQELANFKVLHEKLYHFHWYVKGEAFYRLHAEFQTDYEQIAQFIDEVAERILMLKGKPVSKLRDSLELATIKENQHDRMNYFEMVVTLQEDLEAIIKEFEYGLKEHDFDKVTEDMLVGMLSYFEKRLWMHSAFLSSTAFLS